MGYRSVSSVCGQGYGDIGVLAMPWSGEQNCMKVKLGIIALAVICMLVSPEGVVAARPTDGAPATHSHWVPATPMSTTRIQATGTPIGHGRVLVAGGYGCPSSNGPMGECPTAEVFDSGSESWAATMSPPYVAVGQTAIRLLDGRVLVVGGWLSPWAELYNARTANWNPTTAPPVSASFRTGTLLQNGHCCLAGGYEQAGCGLADGRCGPLAQAEVYVPSAGRWTPVGSMHAPRYLGTATRLPNGDVLATGGEGCEQRICSSAELYHPRSGVWTLTASMHVPREQQTATLLRTGQVLVTGGYGCLPSNVCSSAELYDPASGSWQTTRPHARSTGRPNRYASEEW